DDAIEITDDVVAGIELGGHVLAEEILQGEPEIGAEQLELDDEGASQIFACLQREAEEFDARDLRRQPDVASLRVARCIRHDHSLARKTPRLGIWVISPAPSVVITGLDPVIHAPPP